MGRVGTLHLGRHSVRVGVAEKDWPVAELHVYVLVAPEG